jgi:hypothetical protein
MPFNRKMIILKLVAKIILEAINSGVDAICKSNIFIFTEHSRFEEKKF